MSTRASYPDVFAPFGGFADGTRSNVNPEFCSQPRSYVSTGPRSSGHQFADFIRVHSLFKCRLNIAGNLSGVIGISLWFAPSRSEIHRMLADISIDWART